MSDAVFRENIKPSRDKWKVILSLQQTHCGIALFSVNICIYCMACNKHHVETFGEL